MVDPQALDMEPDELLRRLNGLSQEQAAMEEEAVLGAPVQMGFTPPEGQQPYVPPMEAGPMEESPEASFARGQQTGMQVLQATGADQSDGDSGLDLGDRRSAMEGAMSEFNNTISNVRAAEVKTLANQQVALEEKKKLDQKLLDERRLALTKLDEEDRRISESGALKHLNSMDYTVMLMKGIRGILKGDPDYVISAVVDAIGADVVKKDRALLESKRKYERKIKDFDFESDQSKIDSDYAAGVTELELRTQARNLTFAAQKASTEFDKQKMMAYVDGLENRANGIRDGRAGKKNSQAPESRESVAKTVGSLDQIAPVASQVLAKTWSETNGKGQVYQATANRAKEIQQLGKDSRNIPLDKFTALMKEAEGLPVSEAKALRGEVFLGVNAEPLLEELDKSLKKNEEKLRAGALVPFKAEGGIKKALRTAGSIGLNVLSNIAPNTQIDETDLSLQQMNNAFFNAAKPIIMKGESLYHVTEKEMPLIKPVEYKRNMTGKDAPSIYKAAMHNTVSQMMRWRGANRAELAALYKRFTQEDYR